MKRGPSSRIYSIYFTTEEEELIRAIAKWNGTSLSMVVRTSVRRFALLPAPRLELPPSTHGLVEPATGT